MCACVGTRSRISLLTYFLTCPPCIHTPTWQSVPYAQLFKELGLGEGGGKVRELEDLIIETIYMVRTYVLTCS